MDRTFVDTSSNQTISGKTFTDIQDLITKGPWVDVRAVVTGGSGTIGDKWTGFESTLNSLPAGTKIVFPPGYYSFSTNLVLGPGIGVEGYGQRLTFLYFTGASGYAFTFGTTSSSLSYGNYIRGMSIIATQNAANIITAKGTAGFLAEDIYWEAVVGSNTSTGLFLDGGNAANIFSSIKNIISNHTKISYRLGSTGSLPPTSVNFLACSAFGDDISGSSGLLADLNSGLGTQWVGGNFEHIDTAIDSAADGISFFGARFEANTVDVATKYGASGNVFIGSDGLAVWHDYSGNIHTFLGNYYSGSPRASIINYLPNQLKVADSVWTGNQFVNTVATGTAPLSIASTTQVANLSLGGGGTIDNTPIGGITPSAGSFTNLSVSGQLTSSGITWTIRTSAADNSWRAVTYGNGLFVAVSETGTGNRVMTSPDGITWTSRTSAADNGWIGVTYGNGLFVAVSETGTGNRVMTSPDGITWTIRTSAADNGWNGVTYGNGLFVAVANTGTGNRVMTSPDGITWTIRTSAADNAWFGVTYGNGLFVAVAASGTGNRAMTSPDGITWTIRTSAADNFWYGVTYGNGLFVAVTDSGTGNRVMTSPDGITWTSRTSAADNNWHSVTYGNGLFVAVSVSGTGNRVMTSPDGITWTSRTNAQDNSWNAVTYGNGLFVAVTDSGTGNRVMTSGKQLLSPDPLTQLNLLSSPPAIGSTTPNTGAFTSVNSARIKATSGSSLVSGDFALSGGWGSTAVVGSISGTDQRATFTVTSSGTGQAANPTITLTFHDGTFTTAPFAIVQSNGGTGNQTLPTWTSSATQLIITVPLTPVASSTYTFSFIIIG